MLQIFRRHTQQCISGRKDKKDPGRKYRRCHCPIHYEGHLAGKLIRKSLETSNWEDATELVRDMEQAGEVKAEPITIHEALEKFIKECEARNLNERTIRKYRYLERSLIHYAQEQGIVRLVDLDSEGVRGFRSGWKLGARTAGKTLERLKSFFKFCVENDWLPKNPAQNIKAPQIKPKAIEPYTDEQFQHILQAAQEKPRLYALVLVLRYTGLRISDAVMLRRDSVTGEKVRLYTQKSGVPVYLPVPPHVIAALRGLDKKSTQYFFATGEGKDQTAINNARDDITKILRKAEVNGSPHTFRHTFATDLLSKGVEETTVATILGNSPAIVRKHYSHWTLSRNDHLDESVKRTWATPALKLVKK